MWQHHSIDKGLGLHKKKKDRSTMVVHTFNPAHRRQGQVDLCEMSSSWCIK